MAAEEKYPKYINGYVGYSENEINNLYDRALQRKNTGRKSSEEYEMELGDDKNSERKVEKVTYRSGEQVYLTNCGLCFHNILGGLRSISEHKNTRKHRKLFEYHSQLHGRMKTMEWEPKLNMNDSTKYFIVDGQIESDNIMQILEVHNGPNFSNGIYFFWCNVCHLKFDDNFVPKEHLNSELHLQHCQSESKGELSAPNNEESRPDLMSFVETFMFYCSLNLHLIATWFVKLLWELCLNFFDNQEAASSDLIRKTNVTGRMKMQEDRKYVSANVISKSSAKFSAVKNKKNRRKSSRLSKLFREEDKRTATCGICHEVSKENTELHSHMTCHFWKRFENSPLMIEEVSEEPSATESSEHTEDSYNTWSESPTRVMKSRSRKSHFKNRPLDIEIPNSLNIYEIDKQKMNEIKGGVLLSLQNSEDTFYCIICRRDVKNNLQTFYEHLCSAKHLDYLKDMLEDEILFQDCGNEFSDLALGYEYMEDISHSSVKCHACEVSVSNNLFQLHEHVNSANHIDQRTILNGNSRELFKELKSKMECNFYSIMKYWCVICSVKFITEYEFQKHLKKNKHLKKTLRFNDEFLMFDYCGVCASLWYGFLKTFSYHSKCKMHKYHKFDGFFSISKLPEPAERLLNSAEEKIGAILKDFEFRRSIDRIKEAQLLHDLREIAVEYYPDAVAHPFGSRITGLDGINSDLDVFLDCPTKNNSMYFGTNSHPKLIERRLEKIKECLENNTNIWHIDREILDCRIPIIKTKHKPSDIDCDLSFTNGLTVENTLLIRNYCDKSSDCRKLIMFIKNWMNQCELSGANGINSYGIAWLVIYFLQTKKILPTVNQLIEMKNHSQLIAGWETGVSNDFQVQTFGESFDQLLKQFFTFYGNFDYRNDVICPLLGEIVKKIDFQHRGKLPSTMWSYSNYLYDSADAEPFRVDSIMCLQDPFDLAHNITKAVKKFKIYQFKTFCCYSAQILDNNG